MQGTKNSVSVLSNKLLDFSNSSSTRAKWLGEIQGMGRNGRRENKHTATLYLIDLLLKLACLVLVQSIAVFNGKIVRISVMALSKWKVRSTNQPI